MNVLDLVSIAMQNCPTPAQIEAAAAMVAGATMIMVIAVAVMVVIRNIVDWHNGNVIRMVLPKADSLPLRSAFDLPGTPADRGLTVVVPVRRRLTKVIDPSDVASADDRFDLKKTELLYGGMLRR